VRSSRRGRLRWTGVSPAGGGSVARCLSVRGRTARATAAAVTPHPPPGGPAVTHPGDRTCKSGQAVLLAPGILSPRKDHRQERSLRSRPPDGASATPDL
jgi:hypothetical protein